MIDLFWLRPGAVAGSSVPMSTDDLAVWHELGIRAVVSLVEQRLDFPGFDALHLPVPDFTAPTSEQLRRAIEFMDEQIAAGRPVAVHCLGGKGRTGTVLAAWLIAHGESAEHAVAEVRALRPGAIETDAQLACLRTMSGDAE